MEHTLFLGKTKQVNHIGDEISQYCYEHCSFDHPRKGGSCRNFFVELITK